MEMLQNDLVALPVKEKERFQLILTGLRFACQAGNKEPGTVGLGEGQSVEPGLQQGLGFLVGFDVMLYAMREKDVHWQCACIRDLPLQTSQCFLRLLPKCKVPGVGFGDQAVLLVLQGADLFRELLFIGLCFFTKGLVLLTGTLGFADIDIAEAFLDAAQPCSVVLLLVVPCFFVLLLKLGDGSAQGGLIAGLVLLNGAVGICDLAAQLLDLLLRGCH